MPVGGSVDEGVAILVLRGAMSERLERCSYEAVEHLGGVVCVVYGAPRVDMVRGDAGALRVRVTSRCLLAYKTTRKCP